MSRPLAPYPDPPRGPLLIAPESRWSRFVHGALVRWTVLTLAVLLVLLAGFVMGVDAVRKRPLSDFLADHVVTLLALAGVGFAVRGWWQPQGRS